jgi:hypothetical protein
MSSQYIDEQESKERSNKLLSPQHVQVADRQTLQLTQHWKKHRLRTGSKLLPDTPALRLISYDASQCPQANRSSSQTAFNVHLSASTLQDLADYYDVSRQVIEDIVTEQDIPLTEVC